MAQGVQGAAGDGRDVEAPLLPPCDVAVTQERRVTFSDNHVVIDRTGPSSEEGAGKPLPLPLAAMQCAPHAPRCGGACGWGAVVLRGRHHTLVACRGRRMLHLLQLIHGVRASPQA